MRRPAEHSTSKPHSFSSIVEFHQHIDIAEPNLFTVVDCFSPFFIVYKFIVFFLHSRFHVATCANDLPITC